MKKPPMCLQYTIWALAAVGHARYHQYHEIFYRRARQYVEADEMSVSEISITLCGSEFNAVTGPRRTFHIN